MTAERVNQLLLAIPALEAHEQLILLKVSDYEHMKPEARKKLFKALNKLANPPIIEEENKKPMTTDQLASILNQG